MTAVVAGIAPAREAATMIVVLGAMLALAGCASEPRAAAPPVLVRDGAGGWVWVEADTCALVAEQIEAGGTVTVAQYDRADDAWSRGYCDRPVVAASYGELHDACRALVGDTTVGGAMVEDPGTAGLQPDDVIHPRAWLLRATGKLDGFTCRIGSWSYTWR